MKRGNYRITHGRNQQFLMPSYKMPPNDRKNEIEDFKNDDQHYRIYTDASELQKQGIFGVAFTCVGGGSVIVQSKKVYNKDFKSINVYGEVAAVAFAFEKIPVILEDSYILPKRLSILCDLNWIENLETSNWARREKTKQLVDKIINHKRELQISFPTTDIKLKYCSKQERKYNPYYKASHNACRKIIGLK